jgi:hypothetical protein
MKKDKVDAESIIIPVNVEVFRSNPKYSVKGQGNVILFCSECGTTDVVTLSKGAVSFQNRINRFSKRHLHT